jgi:hypothetical protein
MAAKKHKSTQKRGETGIEGLDVFVGALWSATGRAERN